MDTQRGLRQQGIIDLEKIKEARAIIVGCGGIGSPLALSLVQLGIKELCLIDPDRVEAHNLGTQLYTMADIGQAKSTKLREHIQPYNNDTSVINFSESFSVVLTYFSIEEYEYIFSCVDNMATRSEIFKTALGLDNFKGFFEARVGGELFRCYGFNINDEKAREFYMQTLYDDSEAVELPCTERMTSYIGFMVASQLTNMFAKVVLDIPTPKEIIGDMKTYSQLKN